MKFPFALVLALAACSTAAAQDITTGLAAHYTFDVDGSDATVNDRDMAVVGTPAPTHVAGHIGNCARFLNHEKCYLREDGAFMNGRSTFTIACWVRRQAGSGNTASRAVHVGDRFSGSFLSIVSAERTAYTQRIAYNDAAAPKAMVTHSGPATTPTDDAWQFVCVVVSSGTATVYGGARGRIAAERSRRGELDLAWLGMLHPSGL